MSSKLRQRCTAGLTCVAILLLVAVIVTVWVMLNQGAFKSKHRRINVTTTPTQIYKQKEYIEKTHLDDLESDIEFVKPMKISPVPLHDHDIIFDQLRNNNDNPPLRHHSGHFRHKQAEIWDPHPRYVIKAFGQELHLELEHNDDAIDRNLHVTHVDDNYTHKVRQDPTMYGCYYSGKIKDDFDSDVVVSLCNGMTGYIRTSQDTYYIEPAEKLLSGDSLGSFLHRIKKIPHISPISDNDVVNTESDQCETNDNNSSIVEDDFGSTVFALPSGQHTINKRQVVFDDVGENDTIPSEEVFRTTREADWPINYENDRKTNEYFVKVLVVADRSMIQYHQSIDDLKHYILILMSHAALLYKDASIGNSISLSVVNIWMLNNTVFTSNNSQVMLRKFCDWQKRYVPDRRHDMALLFTRDPICKKNASFNCDTLGVAEVGSMCNPSSSCAIVKERGLSSSYTIAHELGHVLSMLHDETESCSAFPKSPKYGNIMSRVLNNETKPWLWSECSKHFVTEFLESNKAKCLTKVPTNNFISSEISEVLPGENFQLDRQCELEFGNGFRRCPYKQPHCRFLWCTTNDLYGCKSNLLPWADGTSCGRNRWCHHGECIPLDRQLLTPIAGGWGSWQPWSDCSRTCGGGIKHSKRHCDSPIPQNGGSYCTGRNIQYVSCNTQPCNGDVPDFRELQCAQFDGITKNLPNLTKDVQWVPKYGLNQREDWCKLYCRPKNSNAYYQLKEKVIDGTKCGLNSFDICVNGICRPGGCDNKLNSKVDLDECGVCGGDNSQCEEITGTYNISMTGYNIVLKIPKGSSNIDIKQNANNDTNYLILVDGETGDYVLNRKTMIAPQQKEVIFGGVIISYSGSSAEVERITTPKNHKLTKDLVLWVLSVGDAVAPDITYRYIINKDNAPKYGWRLYRKQWSKCNSICSGIQYMNPVCVELATNKEQPDSYCSELEKQHQMQKQNCNLHCRLQWDDVTRGPCSVNCGKGVRSVSYRCIKVDVTKENYDYREVIDDKHCSILPKPPLYEMCQGRCESTRWEYSNWSECPVSCGGGTQRRSAKCVDITSQIIDDSHCLISERITEQACNNQKCPVWVISREWTPCSVSCGRGFRTKPYYCAVDNKVYDPSACDPRHRHVEEEECMERPCAGWSTSHWSECSQTCGDGIQTRRVVCKNLDGNREILQDNFCNGMLKPNDTKPCLLNECIQNLPYQRRFDYRNDITTNSISYDRGVGYRWITGAWSQCTKSCNSGISSRMVVCGNELGVEKNEMYCSHKSVPIRTIECNTHACPSWEYGGWSDCDSNCEKRRQVTCRNSSGNFVEDSQCDKDTKPNVMAKCQNCYTNGDYSKRYKWNVGKWKKCTTSCGEGQKHRLVMCQDVKLKRDLVDQYCAHLPKPKTTARCEKYSCSFVWLTTPWSQCSAICGQGTQYRNVTCHRVHQKGTVDPLPLTYDKTKPHDFCNRYEKPVESTVCNGNQCGDIYVWRSEPWRECSASCGKKGRRTRQIYCMNIKTGRRVEKRQCPKNLKPKRRLKCNQWRCLLKSCREIQYHTKTKTNKDYMIMIRNRPATVYCYKMDTNQPEEYITLHGDSQNYAENYDKRLKSPNSCPYDGQRVDNCDCWDIGPERSGFTTFWKVRLNVTSLRIIGDDFTFSRQNHGMKVPYGTAGDCYSTVEGCAQGRFSIDLTGTSFKLSKRVRWHSIGKYASSRIDYSDTTIRGQCGGYCGNCVTDNNVGLEVEIA